MTDLELYNQAKEAYYNGAPIMEDFEFDALEEKLGLANKSYIGTQHSPSYTIKHPFIMGSLSKVQIHEKNGVIDWKDYFSQVSSYIYKNGVCNVVITPKYDGCSYELTCCNTEEGTLYINTISSRGDGTFGKDLKKHLQNKFAGLIMPDNRKYTIRGEVLIDKNLFAKKYADFVNPRSFVSGILNRDYDENDEQFLSMLNDLSVVIYDVRVLENGQWIDTDWMQYSFPYLPDFYQVSSKFTSANELQNIYQTFSSFRQSCIFALDGIVLKPVQTHRINNTEESRPKDCVAIKFIPQLQETEVIGIEWNTGKTNELHPVIIVKDVIMDGKVVSRASAHNYGYMMDHMISIGTKVILSLAGDIIPFIYKITNTDAYDYFQMNLPEYPTYTEGCHLYKQMSEQEITEMKFIQSAGALNIPNIGPAAAQKIFDYKRENFKADDFLGIEAQSVPNNILCCSTSDICNALGGKSGAAAAKSFETFVKSITLKDIIVSCTFDSCGQKVAEAIQDYLLLGVDNFEHLANKGWSWCKDENSEQMVQLNTILDACGKPLSVLKNELQYNHEQREEQIPIIMTGEPTTVATKGEFLRQHPEYRETGSWKEVKIVFTSSLDSNTGKMKKAREKGIEIRQY